jgi:hypothetical protein
MSVFSSSRKGRRAKKPALDRDRALVITSSVPVEKGFHFFTDLREPTGIFATSIFDFEEALRKVDLKALEFHENRGDFSRWLREVIRDDTLADELEKIRSLKLTGEKLRAKVVETTEQRCKELADVLKSLAP